MSHPQPEPIDPDIDLHVPEQRSELARHPAAVLGIAAGGVLGAEARAGLVAALPMRGFPVVTLLVNATGCLLIGVLMVLVAEAGRGGPLTRPFLGEVLRLAETGMRTAVGYVLASTAAGLAAAAVGWQLATLSQGR